MNKYDYKRQFGLQVTPTEDAIIREILSYTKKNGLANPSQERIANSLGISTRTVIRHLKNIEKMKINGLPFLIRRKQRWISGKWTHTRYFFPWMIHQSAYKKAHAQKMIQKLEHEYWTEYYQQCDHVTNGQASENRPISIICLRETLKSLRDKLGISAGEALKILSKVGYEIQQGEHIYHLDKYISKAFEKGNIHMKIEERLGAIYRALFGDRSFFDVDMDGYANALLTAQI